MASQLIDKNSLEGVENQGTSPVDDESWKPTEFLHKPVVLAVTQPEGSFCQIDARFSVPLPPDDVYNIITDPNNRRVFKNIKEVVYRKVLQDDGNRQLVEVEQLGRWRFLMISGTFTCRVLVEQNRQEHTMNFDLLKQGMMRKFSGSWKLEPLDEIGPESLESCTQSQNQGEVLQMNGGLGSWVTFNQIVEPSIIPPWPLNGYVRGVTAKIVREILADLQLECTRLAELRKESASDTLNL